MKQPAIEEVLNAVATHFCVEFTQLSGRGTGGNIEIARNAFIYCAYQMNYSLSVISTTLGVSVAIVKPKHGLAKRKFNRGQRGNDSKEFSEFYDACTEILQVLRGEEPEDSSSETVKQLQKRAQKLERDLRRRTVEVEEKIKEIETLKAQLKKTQADAKLADRRVSEAKGKTRIAEDRRKAAELRATKAEAKVLRLKQLLDNNPHVELNTEQVQDLTERAEAVESELKRTKKELAVTKKKLAEAKKAKASTVPTKKVEKPQALKKQEEPKTTAPPVPRSPPPSKPAGSSKTTLRKPSPMINEGTSVFLHHLVEATCKAAKLQPAQFKSGQKPDNRARRAAVQSAFCYLAKVHTKAEMAFVAMEAGMEERKAHTYANAVEVRLAFDDELRMLVHQIRTELHTLRHAV